MCHAVHMSKLASLTQKIQNVYKTCIYPLPHNHYFKLASYRRHLEALRAKEKMVVARIAPFPIIFTTLSKIVFHYMGHSLLYNPCFNDPHREGFRKHYG